jgi:hypothetical protein
VTIRKKSFTKNKKKQFKKSFVENRKRKRSRRTHRVGELISPRLALRRRPTLLRNSRRARSHRDLAWGTSPRYRSRRASRSPSGARQDLSATAPWSSPWDLEQHSRAEAAAMSAPRTVTASARRLHSRWRAGRSQPGGKLGAPAAVGFLDRRKEWRGRLVSWVHHVMLQAWSSGRLWVDREHQKLRLILKSTLRLFHVPS